MSYYGNIYDPVLNQTTYFYSVTSGGFEAGQPELSHITLELVCPPGGQGEFVILDAGTWGYPDMTDLKSGGGHPQPSQFPAMPFSEPTTGLTGIKFDHELKAGETLYFYFTLEGGFPLGALWFVIKAGETLPGAYILGPGCVVPGAVTVSSFEVLRDNDTLRFKWTTESEINNEGFDLFAVEPGSEEWLVMNGERIAPQVSESGLAIEAQEYYYQVDRPGLDVGADFYLRAYDRDGTHEDFGPVQAILSATIVRPVEPAPPMLPVVPPVERPIVDPRSEAVPLPEPVEREQPGASPALPIVEPREPVPGPVVPRLERELRPGPIMGRLF